jgi:hypothetical protein
MGEVGLARRQDDLGRIGVVRVFVGMSLNIEMARRRRRERMEAGVAVVEPVAVRVADRRIAGIEVEDGRRRASQRACRADSG